MNSRFLLLLVLAGVLASSVLAFFLFGNSAEPVKVEGTLPEVAAADWPWWRGPTFDGKSRDKVVVTKWSSTENVVWKTEVPGRGHASPILWGERVFLTTAEDDGQKQSVLAFDRKSGKLLWNTMANQGGFMRKYGKNTHASATPACDGERVYSVFINHDGLHVTATDLDGKILWQKEAGSFKSEHGYGSSPLLYKSLVIVNGDSQKGCFIAALDRATGKTAWKTERKTTGKHGNYATPMIATLDGKPQLIMTGLHEVTSYDPENGKLIWSCAGPAEVTANTAACSDKLVFASGGFPEKELLAIRPDGSGDVTKTHIAWRTGKGVTYVPSPLYHDGHLYVVNDGGTATCFEAATGNQVWQERLNGAFSSSPVLVGDLLYVTNEAGKAYVLKTGPKFEQVAVNDLGDGSLATPAVGGGQLFLRTTRFLYCIGK
jgi:outer membrane protein assembly factor BamB